MNKMQQSHWPLVRMLRNCSHSNDQYVFPIGADETVLLNHNRRIWHHGSVYDRYHCGRLITFICVQLNSTRTAVCLYLAVSFPLSIQGNLCHRPGF